MHLFPKFVTSIQQMRNFATKGYNTQNTLFNVHLSLCFLSLVAFQQNVHPCPMHSFSCCLLQEHSKLWKILSKQFRKNKVDMNTLVFSSLPVPTESVTVRQVTAISDLLIQVRTQVTCNILGFFYNFHGLLAAVCEPRGWTHAAVSSPLSTL